MGFRREEQSIIATTHDGGDTWQTLAPRTAGSLYAVACADAKHAWAVGSGGLVLATSDGGAHCKLESSGTSADLAGAGFSDPLHGWAAGDISSNGPVIKNALLSTSDGGATWVTHTPGIVTDLNGMALLDAAHMWVVGVERCSHIKRVDSEVERPDTHIDADAAARRGSGAICSTERSAGAQAG